MITIVDYGSGNIRAIGNIYDRLSIPYAVAKRPEELINATKIILPGVGAFDETMEELNRSGLRQVLDEQVLKKGSMIMGICVGMQILANSSEEGVLPGLGYVAGKVKKINKEAITQKPKLPHMGWNSVQYNKPNSILNDVQSDVGFYFLHSYYFECDDNDDILCSSEYGVSFTSAINHKNIYGMQFHPEKSHQNGIAILRNFALVC